MKQALHIFKKDVSYLRYEIGMTLLAAAAFCFTGMRQGMTVSGASANQGGPWAVLTILLPVTWWFLISRVIHAEPLTGDKQFWLTRPYEWKSLLGAKALFIVVFVNLPLLVSDAIILPAFGLSITHETAGILWTQVLLIVGFTLPVAALSSIVSGIAPLITALLLLFCGLLASTILAPLRNANAFWMELEWIKIYYGLAVIAAAAMTIVLWQYSRRKTAASRALVGVAAFVVWAGLSLLPWPSAFALQAGLSHQKIDPSDIHIGLDLDRKWLSHIYPATQDQMNIDLPLQITGIPAGMELKPNGLTLTLQAAGEAWRVQEPPPSSINTEAGIISLRAIVGESFYTRVKEHPLQLRGTLFFTLYGNRQRTDLPFKQAPIPVKGLGVCSSGVSFVLCSSAFREQPDLVTFRVFQDSARGSSTRTDSPKHPLSYSPFPADLSINPVAQIFSPQFSPISGAVVETLEPLAHLQRDFEFDNVRLSDFEPHAK